MINTTTNGSRRSVWALRLVQGSFLLAIVSVAVPAVGLTLARYDLVAKMAGFSTLLGGGLVAALGLIVGLSSFLASRKIANPHRARRIAGIVISLVLVGFLASRPLTAGGAPGIHDVTTDVADPPQFEVLRIRADNLVGVGTVENWRKVHAGAYGHLAPITLAKPVAEATADAVRLAQEAGWQIAVNDPVRGRVEATASVSYIRFQDDVVIRIVPAADGRQSRVDMRSVSRVGVGDLGVNARRIEAFLASLAAA